MQGGAETTRGLKSRGTGEECRSVVFPRGESGSPSKWPLQQSMCVISTDRMPLYVVETIWVRISGTCHGHEPASSPLERIRG